MSYSLDFRKQVFKIKAKESLTFQETSERFGVPIRTLFRWQERIEPKTKRDKPSTKVDMEVLQKDVVENPDLYQYERAKKFGVGQSTMFYALKRLGISNKKKLFSIPRQMKWAGLSSSSSYFDMSLLKNAPSFIWTKAVLL